MNIDEPVYSLAEIAKAIGVPSPTVHSHMQRGHIQLLGNDMPSTGNGMPHRLSLRSARYIAVFEALLKHFVPTKHANDAAREWIYVSDEGRDPGELYEVPYTVLCVYPDVPPIVRNSPIAGKVGAAFDLFWSPEYGRRDGGVFLILDHIVKQVEVGLVLSLIHI